MKKTSILFVVLFIIISSVAFSSDKAKIEVINFHSAHRCMTCNLIEQETQAAIKKHFADDIKSGKIVLKIINVSDKKNSKIAEEFQTAGTALFINIIKNGKSQKVDLTDFAFMNVKKKDDTFENKVVSEVKEALKKI